MGENYILQIMIQVNQNIFLSPLKMSDAFVINEYMGDKEISENTLVIPFPYSLSDANSWLEDNLIEEEETGVRKNYAIRNKEGLLMGVIGAHFNYGQQSDKSEFGYWLAKQFWNKGIMTVVIDTFCELMKEKHNLKTLEAHVFDFNPTSMHILTKNGFIRTEGKVNRTKRDGREVSAIRFYKLL